ncbi:MAG: type II secretion system F family protein [Epsilonproteobacteria bacterium]|nr:type II secretion system F family protein [Campylobacterota bacterium]
MYFRVKYIHRGKKNFAVYESNNRVDASAKLRRDYPGAVVISVEEAPPPLSEFFKKIGSELEKIFQSKVSLDDKISVIRQIAVMTDAGIPIYDVLLDIAKNTHNKRLKEMFQSISSDINAGKSMSQALKPFSEEMGHVVMAMTKLGEQTGNFPAAYHKLADILEQIKENRSKFMKAIRYPIITFTAIAIAFVVLITVVVPKFREIFNSFHAELPFTTKLLLNIEFVLRHYGLVVLGVLVGLFMIVRYLYKNNAEFRYKVDKLLVNPRFYLINKIIYLSNMYNYTLVFGALVKAGIPVSEALRTAEGMVQNRYLRRKFEIVNANIGRGMSLAEAFEQTGLFENMLLQMIRAGEQSGQLDAMLGKVRDYYGMKFQNLIDNLSAYIEPIMLVFIAGMVLMIALGIFLPMWSLGQVVKG